MPDHTPMTAAELADARKLERAATPGPWCVSNPGLGINDYPIVVTGAEPTDSSRRIAGVDCLLRSHDNAQFIAASRTLVPRLIATLDARDAEIERLRAEVERLHTKHGERAPLGATAHHAGDPHA